MAAVIVCVHRATSSLPEYAIYYLHETNETITALHVESSSAKAVFHDWYVGKVFCWKYRWWEHRL